MNEPLLGVSAALKELFNLSVLYKDQSALTEFKESLFYIVMVVYKAISLQSPGSRIKNIEKEEFTYLDILKELDGKQSFIRIYIFIEGKFGRK